MYEATIKNNLIVRTDRMAIIDFIREKSKFTYMDKVYDYKLKKFTEKEVVMYEYKVQTSREYTQITAPVGVYGALVAEYGQPELVNNETVLKRIMGANLERQPRDYQKPAIEQLMLRRFNTLEAETGSGKTYVAAALISQLKVRTLFIVPNVNLMKQTFTEFNEILSNVVCGRLGGGFNEISSDIIIGVIDSVASNLEELKEFVSFVIVDEAHRIADNTYYRVLSTLSPSFRLAMTATPFRFDQKERLIEYLVSPITVRMENTYKNQISLSKFFTEEAPEGNYDLTTQFKRFESDLYDIPERTSKIIDLIRNYPNKKIMVVLPRIALITEFERWLQMYGIKSLTLSGKQKDDLLTFAEGDVNVILAIDKIANDGLDIPDLDILINTVVFKDRKKAIQLIGRLKRGQKNKLLIEVIDNHSYCTYAFKQRLMAYREGGLNAENAKTDE